MWKVLILTFAIGIQSGQAPAQQNGSEVRRAELERIRQEKDQQLESIALEAELMQTTTLARREAFRGKGFLPGRLVPESITRIAGALKNLLKCVVCSGIPKHPIKVCRAL